MSDSPIPIIPTLDTCPILTDVRDILAYILRYYTTAPKSVSDTTPRQMISLMDDISKYQGDKSLLVSKATYALQTVYSQFFPQDASSVDITTSDNGDGSYNLIIQLTATVNGSTYTVGGNVSVSNTGILQLTWHPSLN